MLLPYGSQHGNLIHISEVRSGKSALTCPYCDDALIARKGKVVAHHFAHAHKSCMSKMSADFFGLSQKAIPIHLSLQQYTLQRKRYLQQQLQQLEKRQHYLVSKRERFQILLHQLLNQLANDHTDAYFQTLRHLQKPTAPLPNFKLLPHTQQLRYDFLAQIIEVQHQAAETTVMLELYQKDLAWFNKFQLYFLEIQTSDYCTFYKIGLTSRNLTTRIQEIRQSLQSLFTELHIKVCFQKAGIAFLEHFFKLKYQQQRYPIQNYTEYFTFEPFEVEALLLELERL